MFQVHFVFKSKQRNLDQTNSLAVLGFFIEVGNKLPIQFASSPESFHSAFSDI